jgi:hypothetical protein
MLDESTLGHDDNIADQLANCLRRVAEAEAGVIALSHSAPFVTKPDL